MLRFYNSLTRHVEQFKPLKAGQVKLYTCGPTVYDVQTIGNLRTYVLYDTLKRIIQFNGDEVNHVMNITDVGHLTSDADDGEDKLEKGAKKSGKTVWQVADHYTKLFKRDIRRMNIIVPKYARATDFIDQQIAIVKLLLDKGFAYQTTQAIYFDVTKLTSYGQLTGQRLDQKSVGARQEVVTDNHKHNPHDFAVWFFATGRFGGHSMQWPSPWGNGFPGWHLECSAIAHALLDDPIDIHAGAVDLIGTHHTNEMAQTEAAFGHRLANYWLHGEHLLVDNQRMGKSLGNFHTLDDVVAKGFEPMALRLLYLQAHYRNQLNFTWKSIEAAAQNLIKLRAFADLRWQTSETAPVRIKIIEYAQAAIVKALNRDLNTAEALAQLNQIMDQLPVIAKPDSAAFNHLMKTVDQLFGLNLLASTDITADQRRLLARREQARLRQDWLGADRLRDQLAKQGIAVNDTASGVVWSRS